MSIVKKDGNQGKSQFIRKVRIEDLKGMGLSPTDKLVYSMIDGFSKSNKRFYGSIASTSKLLEVGKSTLVRSYKKLEDKGLIKKIVISKTKTYYTIPETGIVNDNCNQNELSGIANMSKGTIPNMNHNRDSNTDNNSNRDFVAANSKYLEPLANQLNDSDKNYEVAIKPLYGAGREPDGFVNNKEAKALFDTFTKVEVEGLMSFMIPHIKSGKKVRSSEGVENKPFASNFLSIKLMLTYRDHLDYSSELPKVIRGNVAKSTWICGNSLEVPFPHYFEKKKIVKLE